MNDYSKKEKNVEKELEAIFNKIVPFMTSEALNRLLNIKAAHPDLYQQAILIIYHNIANGTISKVDDKTLKYILDKISEKKRREPKIRFIH